MKIPHKNILISELILFTVAILITILVQTQLIWIEPLTFPSFSSAKTSTPYLSFWQFIAAFSIATAFLFLAIKLLKKRGRTFFSTIFFIAIFFGLITFFNALFSILFIQIVSTDLFILSLLISLALLFFHFSIKRIWLFDILVIIGVVGISLDISLRMRTQTMILILIALSIYDLLAVYSTKHMVTMFRSMVENKVFFAIIIPYIKSGWNEKLKEVTIGKNFLFIGLGDLALPLILIASTTAINTTTSILASIGLIIGLLINHYILFCSSREKKPIPALPMLSLGTIVGWIIGNLL